MPARTTTTQRVAAPAAHKQRARAGAPRAPELGLSALDLDELAGVTAWPRTYWQAGGAWSGRP